MDEKNLKNLLDSAEWKAFAQASRERDFDPVFLLFDFMQGCIEGWEGLELHEAIRADVQKYVAEHGEIDPVEFVKQVRRERKAKLEAARPEKAASGKASRRTLKKVKGQPVAAS